MQKNLEQAASKHLEETSENGRHYAVAQLEKGNCFFYVKELDRENSTL